MNVTQLPERMQTKILLEECAAPGLAHFCWIWQGYLTRKGYAGQVKFKGRSHFAYRLTYQLLVGEVPDGLELDHLCRRRDCVNPAHLEAVTHLVNMRRGEPLSRTHCKRGGHPLSGENLAIRRHRDGYKLRQCRACEREQGAVRYRRRQARLRAARQDVSA